MKYLDLAAAIDAFRKTNIYFELASYNDDVITLIATVPGQRWEIQFFRDRPPELEIFKSDGSITPIRSEDELDKLVSHWRD